MAQLAITALIALSPALSASLPLTVHAHAQRVAFAPSTDAQLAALPLDRRHPPPPLEGSSALLYDLDSRRTLYAVNPDRPLPMASTTKLMTALLALEHGHLDTQTTVSYAAATIGGSTMGLSQGDTISLRDLLYGLLLPSGNDAAVAIAEALAGSQEAFVAGMNARCRQLGCTNTHFTSPHGLDAPGHYASASDLLRIALADLHYATLRAIVRSRTYVIGATAQHGEYTLNNVNQPIWWFPGVQGMKSGTTSAAGHCDVIYVVRGQRHLLAVLLGMADRYTDVRDVLDYGLQDFTWSSPAQARQIYPPDDFSQDYPDRYIAGSDPSGRLWRYYVGSGYYVRPPFLGYVSTHAELGLPASEATTLGTVQMQRFGNTIVIYHSQTDTISLVDTSRPAGVGTLGDLP